MNSKIIASLILLTPFMCVGEPEFIVVEKDNLRLGDQTFDARYIEYTNPIPYKNWTPVEGNTPEWAKPGEISATWYQHSYDEITNCLSKASLEMAGFTSEESFAKEKTKYIEENEHDNPIVYERSLHSELYLTNKNHRYLYVTFKGTTQSPKSSTSSSSWLEEMKGKWMDITCDTMMYDWVRTFLISKEEIIAQLKEK